MQTTSTSSQASDEDKYEDPPPYSVVIASSDNLQNQNVEISNESNVSPSKSIKNRVADVSATTSASTSFLQGIIVNNAVTSLNSASI